MELSSFGGLRVNPGDASSSRNIIIVQPAEPVNIPNLLTREGAAH